MHLPKYEYPTPSQVTLRDLLMRDHARLERLLEALISAFQANDASEVARVWAQLDVGLDLHFTLEERHIFPEFAKVQRAQTESLEQEHRELRDRLLTLGVGVDLHLTRLEAAENFVRSLRAHTARESALLYRWADVNLDEHARSALTADTVASTLTSPRVGPP